MSSAPDSTPAILGGTATFGDGPPSWPPRGDHIREALLRAWEDGSWGRYHGPNGPRLETALAEFHGGKHALLCCSGTYAVELALRALGVSAGDKVLLAGYDFPGNFRAIEAVGAWPVLVDIQSNSFAPTLEAMEDTLAVLGIPPGEITALIISHLHGGLADMPRIMAWAKHHEILVVEDACQATGALIKGKRAGGWGDVGVLSFGGSKLLTAGRGGALLFYDDRHLQRAKVHSERGNQSFPLSELQAAVLLPQLDELPEYNRRRNASVQILRRTCRVLPGLELVCPDGGPEQQPSYYKVAWRFVASGSRWDSRDAMIEALRAEGVDVGPGFRGFALRSTRRCSRRQQLPESAAASKDLFLLHHAVLLEPEDVILRLAEAFRKVAHAGRG